MSKLPGSSLRRLRLPLLFLGLLVPAMCWAHSQQDGDGFVAGLFHPVLGFDHLLAMVSVGIVSAQLGGANVWRVPLAFVSAMLVGGIVGAFQVPMPYRELSIAASVLFLGVAVIRVARDTSPVIPFFFVLIFGMCHGHAHGFEMPHSVSPVFYTFGFLISTTVLHLVGLGIGEVAIKSERRWATLRYMGAGQAGIGLVFLLTGLHVQVL